MIARRAVLLAAPALLLSGCKVFDRLPRDGALRNTFEAANGLSYRAQRLLGGGRSMAPEYARADVTQPMRPNGTVDPPDADYQALRAGGFADWRLTVSGLVERPLSLSLAELRAMPARTQITRLDCVEGWSVIAEWTGVQLRRVLDLARPTAEARFVVFRCMDTREVGLAGAVKYWESHDLVDATHPQTILAWGLNGEDLPVANGAPLRLRVERALGYKMAKYLGGIELVATLDGPGSYWAERGYDWYAGI